ncbi:uncharacterized protein LOC117335843 isoform X2 [Pecten maximus]|uniref:uncharacterized protein LOC117335843 isoform X2 n=1 Tax=Pecten maximus TaxID=6579 RepID=UPI0014583DC0|nr:uncharacterized protein LOC117335843 isoform X2 [Pecten maximus]
MASDEKKTSYFIAKCDSIASLRKCIDTSRWACRNRREPPHPSDLLTHARTNNNRVVIIFSVNNCHGWHGYAEMASGVENQASTNSCSKGTKTELKSVTENTSESTENKHLIDENVSNHTDWNYFDVKWITHFLNDFGERCLSSKATEGEEYRLTDNTPLNKARNWQEVPSGIGSNLCLLIDKFYEELKSKRQEKMKMAEENQPPPFFHSSDEVGLMNENWMKISEKITQELGSIIMACPFGSRRYNLHTPTSDMDMFLVYQARTRDILGFNPPKQTLKSERESCDFTIHEIFHFGELLMSGDHRCVETLFVADETLVHTSAAFKRLQQHKHLFVNSDIVKGGNIIVYRPEESTERATLMNIRQGTPTIGETWGEINRYVIGSFDCVRKCSDNYDNMKKW